MADPRTINASLELLLVSRNLERVADLATNIGEDAVFLAEGKQIKHHAEKRGEIGSAAEAPAAAAEPATKEAPASPEAGAAGDD
jgi:phosphate uptake regulator